MMTMIIMSCTYTFTYSSSPRAHVYVFPLDVPPVTPTKSSP